MVTMRKELSEGQGAFVVQFLFSLLLSPYSAHSTLWTEVISILDLQNKDLLT